MVYYNSWLGVAKDANHMVLGSKVCMQGIKFRINLELDEDRSNENVFVSLNPINVNLFVN